eukprot:6214107-Pleurochrysis_carterae.AAC.5
MFRSSLKAPQRDRKNIIYGNWNFCKTLASIRLNSIRKPGTSLAIVLLMRITVDDILLHHRRLLAARALGRVSEMMGQSAGSYSVLPY